MTADERRSAALLLWPETAPAVGERALAAAAAPFRRRLAPLPLRLAQVVATKRRRLGWEAGVAGPLAAARRAALGEVAPGEPRALVRVDEFPHARAFDPHGPFGTDRFRRFHSVLAEAEIPYLLAITPRVSRDYLDPSVSEWRPLDDTETDQLLRLQREGVAFGLHGLDHRTRRRSPQRRSELCGLGMSAAAERIDAARRSFDALGVGTAVFVPPFNRFDRRQYAMLAEHFEVVCGGPESVRLLGFGPTPAWRGDSVYLPSYPPLYGRAVEVAAEVERLADQEAALWAPVTLHWGWEMGDELAGLRKLCGVLASRVADWRDFLAAVAASRTAA